MPDGQEGQGGQNRPKPAIRTMQSDVQELFKTSRPSLMQIIGQGSQESPTPHKRSILRFRTYALASAGIIAVVIGGIAGFYFFFRETAPELPQKAAVPAPFFAAEASRTISVEQGDRALLARLMEDSSKELEREGHIKRILIKILEKPQERFAEFTDFAEFYRLGPPKSLQDQIRSPFMPFFYYTQGSARFGFATKIANPDRTLASMLLWETELATKLIPLFFGAETESTTLVFEDRTYRNIDWRYKKLSSVEDLGIAYMIFPAKSLLVVTTSKDSMETVISRLFDAR